MIIGAETAEGVITDDAELTHSNARLADDRDAGCTARPPGSKVSERARVDPGGLPRLATRGMPTRTARLNRSRRRSRLSRLHDLR